MARNWRRRALDAVRVAPRVTRERLMRWGRKNPATAGLIGAVGLLLLVGSVVAWLLVFSGVNFAASVAL